MEGYNGNMCEEYLLEIYTGFAILILEYTLNPIELEPKKVFNVCLLINNYGGVKKRAKTAPAMAIHAVMIIMSITPIMSII